MNGGGAGGGEAPAQLYQSQPVQGVCYVLMFSGPLLNCTLLFFVVFFCIFLQFFCVLPEVRPSQAS